MPAHVGRLDRHYHQMGSASGDFLLATGAGVRLAGLRSVYPPHLDAGLTRTGSQINEVLQLDQAGVVTSGRRPPSGASASGPGHAAKVSAASRTYLGRRPPPGVRVTGPA